MRLPKGFEALECFVDTWVAHSATERDALRTHQDAASRQTFYDVVHPLLLPALDLLDQTDLSAHDAAQNNLMLLTLAYAHVALAVEVQGPDEARHARSRIGVPITRAPADG
jgi:hypothetical protein